MLLGFGAKNFFCFKEGVEVSFMLKPNSPAALANGTSIVDVLCVKGANSSGKTNLLKIISFLSYFCCDSFENKPETDIGIETFFNSDDSSNFFAEFIINGTQFKYELTVKQNKILTETIYRKKNRFVKIIERKGSKVTTCINEYHEIEIIKLRANASIISTAYQYEIDSILDIYSFFKKIVTNVNLYGIYSQKYGLSYISELYMKDKQLFDFVKNIIKSCDMGVTDIKIKKIKDEEDADLYYPIFYHKTQDSLNPLLFRNQSSGTRALYNQLWIYDAILFDSGVLVLDEFDINLHPHILPVLLELFLNKETNRNNAQLIFTTHNTKIMDELGKYKIFLTNKEDNESYGYRLDEIPGEMVRNDRPLSPIYNSGKIGGVPIL